MSHVLLIEPDRVLAETYASVLKSEGHSVTACAGAQAAIMAADEQQPDLVILELQLVEHSGIEFLCEFRSYPEWHAIPVLIHSHVPGGEFAANRQLLAEQLSVHHYLYKPSTSLSQLISAVNLQLALPA